MADGDLSSVERRGGGGRAERAYLAIRDAIQEGVLRPGQRIVETELGARLAVSRTPVREALRRLESEGLLEPTRGGGLAVKLLDQRAVAELYDIRQSLEGAAAGLAARHADPTEVSLLVALARAQRRLPEDPRLHARENKAFHEQLYRAAHNRFLLQSLRALHDALALLGPTTFEAPGRIAAALDQHDAIVAAIVARNPEAAEAAARHHIRSGYEIRVEAMAEALGRRHEGLAAPAAAPHDQAKNKSKGGKR